MKILVLQLARCGDIYQTWPVLRALKRQHPDAELTFLVREKYAEAADGCEAVDRLVKLPTKDILAPFFFSQNAESKALVALDAFIGDLTHDTGEGYDKIINLSFSPFSSYLVDELKRPDTQVFGYSRHADGYLAIEDDASAYFFAQAGVGRHNRIHLIDLFAMVAGVDLCRADFVAPTFIEAGRWDRDYVVIHLGASHRNKVCTPAQWIQIVENLRRTCDADIYLVGTANERIADLANKDARIIDLTGQTRLRDLFTVLQSARALIACDSLLVQIANFTNTPTLNISFDCVNFWETGPRAERSRILHFQNVDALKAQDVADATVQLLRGEEGGNLFAKRSTEGATPGVQYEITSMAADVRAEFRWNLIRAIYMGDGFPQAERYETVVAFQRLTELAALGLDQLDVLASGKDGKIAVSILDEVDHLLQHISLTNPDVTPVVSWFATEKIRIGPQPMGDLIAHTHDIFKKLLQIARLYSLSEDLRADGQVRGDLTWK